MKMNSVLSVIIQGKVQAEIPPHHAGLGLGAEVCVCKRKKVYKGAREPLGNKDGCSIFVCTG